MSDMSDKCPIKKHILCRFGAGSYYELIAQIAHKLHKTKILK